MKYIFLFLILVLGPSDFSAQGNGNGASYETTDAQDSIYIKLLDHHFFRAFVYRISNIDSALYHIDAGIQMFEEHDLSEANTSIYKFYYRKAVINYLNENYEEALNLLDELESKLVKSSEEYYMTITDIYCRRGLIFAQQSKHEKALTFFKKGLGLAEESGESANILTANSQIATYYRNHTDRLDSAAYYLVNAAKHSEPGSQNAIVVYTNLGNLNATMYKDEQAIGYFDKALENAATKRNAFVYSYASGRAAYYSMLRNDFIKARNHIEDAISIAEKYDEEQQYYDALYVRARLYDAEQNAEAAFSDYKVVYDFYQRDPRNKNKKNEVELDIAHLMAQSSKTDAFPYYDKSKKEIDFSQYTIRNQFELLDKMFTTAKLLGDDQYALKMKLGKIDLIKEESTQEFNLITRQIHDKYRHELDSKTNEIKIQALKKENSRTAFVYFTVFALILSLIFVAYMVYKFLKRKAFNNHLKEHSNQLAESNRKLAEKYKGLTKFAHIISDDLKIPMTKIMEHSKSLKLFAKGHGHSRLSEYADQIQNSSVRMNNLIDDLLNYIKVDVNAPVKFEDVDLGEVIDEVKETISQVKHSGLVVVENSDQFVIHANRSEIYSIFQNLIVNGLHYNISEEPEIQIKMTKQNEILVISVKDNGIGIPADHKEQIFTMFKRLHNQALYKGTGLGLSLVKKIVNQMDGTIDVKSKVDQGSEFIIKLPADIIVAKVNGSRKGKIQ